MIKWKTAQTRDAAILNLVSNANRPAKPNSPDGISIIDVIEYLGTSEILQKINTKNLCIHTGFYNESKAGYSMLPKALRQVPLWKQFKILICKSENDDFVIFKKSQIKEVFRLHSMGSGIIEKPIIETIEFEFPKYMLNWMKQAEMYRQDKTYLWPLVFWWPQGVSRYDNGIVYTKLKVLNNSPLKILLT
jgi:hypothetical protein